MSVKLSDETVQAIEVLASLTTALALQQAVNPEDANGIRLLSEAREAALKCVVAAATVSMFDKVCR